MDRRGFIRGAIVVLTAPLAAEGHHERRRGVILVPGALLFTHRSQIAELATKGRLPVIGWERALVTSGALISYGSSNFDIGRRAAGVVAKIFKVRSRPTCRSSNPPSSNW